MALAGAVVVPTLAFLMVPAVVFVSNDVRALEGVVRAAVLLAAVTLTLGGVAALVLLIRGRRLAQDARESYARSILLASWTYGDTDLAVARRVWRARGLRGIGAMAATAILAGPALPLLSSGVPWTTTQGLVVGVSLGLGLLILPQARNYFLDHAREAASREVRIWSDGVLVRGVASTFGPGQPPVDFGTWGREPIPVLRLADKTGCPRNIPIPRSQLDTAQAVATYFGFIPEEARGAASATDPDEDRPPR